MTLTAGTKLGPYEIIAPIGAGGMGSVYEALHEGLRRRVALKTFKYSITYLMALFVVLLVGAFVALKFLH